MGYYFRLYATVYTQRILLHDARTQAFLPLHGYRVHLFPRECVRPGFQGKSEDYLVLRMWDFLLLRFDFLVIMHHYGYRDHYLYGIEQELPLLIYHCNRQ